MTRGPEPGPNAQSGQVAAPLSQFTADAAHELRARLAVMLGQVELIRSRARRHDDERYTLAVLNREIERLGCLADRMCGRAEAGKGELQGLVDQ